VILARKRAQRKIIRQTYLKLLLKKTQKLKKKVAEYKTKALQTPKFRPKVKKGEVDNFYDNSVRAFTLSLVVPSSIIDNAQSVELKTYLVGQIAKAATMFNFDEVVILSCDQTTQMKMMTDLTTTEFFVQNLEYAETPQYLRKALFPKS